MKPGLLAGIAALSALAAPAAERWRVQYFYDPPDLSEFAITALAFPSAQRGIAVGTVAASGGKEKPYAVATSDGGAHSLLRPPAALVSSSASPPSSRNASIASRIAPGSPRS